MIITINGKPCSGKSTMSKIFANKYGFKRIAIGDIFREEARKRGLSIEEFSKLRVNDPSFDLVVDKEIEKLGSFLKDEDIVFDSRMAWHFIPQSFKVFLDLHQDEMAKRLIDREGHNQYKNVLDAKKAVVEREENDNKVYKQIYNVETYNIENYDLIIDSFNKTPEQIADRVWQEFEIWKIKK